MTSGVSAALFLRVGISVDNSIYLDAKNWAMHHDHSDYRQFDRLWSISRVALLKTQMVHSEIIFRRRTFSCQCDFNEELRR